MIELFKLLEKGDWKHSKKIILDSLENKNYLTNVLTNPALIVDKSGCTLFHHASRFGDHEFIYKLIEVTTTEFSNKKNSVGFYPVDFALHYNVRYNFDFISKLPFDSCGISKRIEKLALIAAQESHIVMVSYILENYIKLLSSDVLCRMHILAKRTKNESVSMLLSDYGLSFPYICDISEVEDELYKKLA